MENLLNVSTYRQCLKILYDQLWNVDAPMNNYCLVIQLIFDLIHGYWGVATLIRRSNLLLSFHQARSMLTLEVVGLAKMTPN